MLMCLPAQKQHLRAVTGCIANLLDEVNILAACNECSACNSVHIASLDYGRNLDVAELTASTCHRDVRLIEYACNVNRSLAAQQRIALLVGDQLSPLRGDCLARTYIT